MFKRTADRNIMATKTAYFVNVDGNEEQIGAIYRLHTGTGYLYVAQGHDFNGEHADDPMAYDPISLGTFPDVAAAEQAIELNARQDVNVAAEPVKLTDAQRKTLREYANADCRGLSIFGSVDHRLKGMGLIEHVGGHVSHRMHKISDTGRAALGQLNVREAQAPETVPPTHAVADSIGEVIGDLGTTRVYRRDAGQVIAYVDCDTIVEAENAAQRLRDAFRGTIVDTTGKQIRMEFYTS